MPYGEEAKVEEGERGTGRCWASTANDVIATKTLIPIQSIGPIPPQHHSPAWSPQGPRGSAMHAMHLMHA